MGDLDRQEAVETAQRAMVRVISAAMVLNILSIMLTGYGTLTAVCGVLLMVSGATLFVINLVSE